MINRPLTVLQMLPALDNGGVERGTLEVAEALVEKGHRSLVMSAGGRLCEPLQAQGSEHYQWPIDRKSPWTLRLIWPLRKFLKQNKVDIVHYRSRVPGWVAYLAWFGMPAQQRPKLISTLHGLHSISWYSAVMAKGEAVIAVSDTVKAYLMANYLQDDSIVKTIYRGVDADAFPVGFQPSSEWLHKWNLECPNLIGSLVIALPGRLTRLKGHIDFIQIVKKLNGLGVKTKGLIIGGEDPKRLPYAHSLYQLVKESKLEESIQFLGYRADMREIYSQSDVVLSLSNKPESFGRTVLEALSMGRPVVGFNHGGVGEVLATLFPFGLVKLGDLDELVQKLVVLNKGDSPVVNANNRFLKSQMLADTLDLYKSICDGS